jgi:hypothetical protein
MENLRQNKAGVRWWHDCHNVVLGPEGKFYACDKPLALPIGTAAGQYVGDAAKGMEWEKRSELLAGAREFVEQRGEGADEVFCPMGVYFFAQEKGVEPAPLLDNFHRVAQVFGEGLGELVAECERFPAFQDIYLNARVV